eukprot:TRINITY_DN652_c0_g2_i3.p1 TRINITY_DN652_c0_g2~~TRINITY_DN652_c0_g2_i3.p1  ORF type:complete len:577 (-),score=189.12 TRINITY_DN652_c0_g2_i3:48-1526(-)
MGMFKKKALVEYKGPVPTIKMRQLFWVKLPDIADTVNKTIWVQKKLTEGTVPIPADELEALFPQNPKRPEKEVKKSAPQEEKPKVVYLLETKRSNNMCIALSHSAIKPYASNWSELADLVRAASEKLDLDTIQILQKNVPEDAEITTLKSYSGDRALLPKAETFLLAMLEVDMFNEKVAMLAFRGQFDAAVTDVISHVSVFENAVQEIDTNNHLEVAFKTILAVGNFLNCGTSQGNAPGFKMATLKKLADLRSPVQGRLSLLQYVVNLVDKNSPESLNFPDEMTNLSTAANQSLQDVVADIVKLKEQYKANSNALKKQKDTTFVDALAPFFRRAEIEIADLQKRSDNVNESALKLVALYGEESGVATCVSDFFKAFKDFCCCWGSCVKQLNNEKEQLKKKQAREAKQAAAAAKGITVKKGVPPPEENTVDNLMNAIKGGNFKLRRGGTTVAKSGIAVGRTADQKQAEPEAGAASAQATPASPEPAKLQAEQN